MARLWRLYASLIGPLVATSCTSRGDVHDAAETGTTSDATTGDSSGASVETTATGGSASTSAATDPATTTADGTTAGEQLVCGLAEADASLAAWEALREKAGGTYYYVGQRFQMSALPFSGPDCEYRTLVVVDDGAITRRAMDEVQLGEAPCAPGWVEQDGELGTHSSPEDGLPAPVWTLDEVYASCCELLSGASADVEPGFFADDQALLERCFLRELSCGDCPNSAPPEWGDEIRIVEIGVGSPPR